MVLKTERTAGFPFPVVEADTRKNSFCEVQLPYTTEQAMAEADRCVRCGNPVCIDICPLQTDIRGMCDAVATGDFARAYHRIRETNALPGVTARCCPQLDSLCEKACVMGVVGQPVAAGMIQRFVSDWERKNAQPGPEVMPPTGKRVAIVGGGPSGLAAADLLRRYGHSVVVYEQLHTMGGTAWYGIPDYHLDKEVLRYEVEKLRKEGVTMTTGVTVGRDLALEDLKEEYDAVLVAAGSKDVPVPDTPGVDLKGVLDGYRFLEDVFVNGVENYLLHPTYELGRKVLVIGGGNSALDCARTALRLTGGDVSIVYRRGEEEMPVDRVLVEEAKSEGVKFSFLAAPASYEGDGGRLRKATMSIMKLGDVDPSGRRRPVPSGLTESVECDTVIVAIGRGPSTYLSKQAGLAVDRRGSIKTDERSQTSVAGVFASGDVVTGESLVVKAMASGRDAAQRIHEYLMSLEGRHVSLYNHYYSRRASGSYYYDQMLAGKEDVLPPP
jgi:glutamate synthase (NADPH) small chain